MANTKQLNPLQQKIIQTIETNKPGLLEVSHFIHSHPELGKMEIQASQKLTEALEARGFTVERGYVGIPTAFCARKKGKKGSPRVAFLAEYDALPEIGHACGHNLISTAALSAGIGLGEVIGDLDGEVWVIGTPAEETDGQKVNMVASGVFDQVDAALMFHAYEGNYSEVETLAMDAIEVEFFGRLAHAAAAPWDGLNALDAAILLFTNINALRQQMRTDGRIHGVIINGGAAPNIIPEYTRSRFYIRASKRAYLNELVEKFKACVHAAAQATGTRVEMRNYENSFDDMVTNVTIANRVRDYMVDSLGSGPFKRKPDSFGSADMGNVSQVVPSVHVMMDIANGKHIAPHTVEFREAACSPYADEAVLRAGKALALAGYDLLTDPSLLDSARQEFEKSLGYAPKHS